MRFWSYLMPICSEAEALEIAAVITAIRQREADRLAWQDWVIGDDFTTDTLYITSRYSVTALVSQKT